MAFSFGGASSSGGLFGASTPAFGASSAAFSFSSTTSAFGSNQPGSNPFGGGFGQSTPAFGASTPAFGASASSTPAFGGGLFQASTPAFGGGGLFGASQPASSPGTGLALALLQQQQQQQQQVPQYQNLVTKDNKPVARSTVWDEIQPQGQAYLLEIEKLVLQTREDLRQLEESDRLQNGCDLKQDMKVDERSAKQSLQALSKELKVQDEAVTAFRERVLQLRRDTETGVRTFMRSKGWRDVSKAGQGQMVPPHVREQLNGPVVLPSMFLRRLVPGLQETLRESAGNAADVERGLPLGGMGSRAAAQDPTEALQATAAGVYDTMIKVAARLSRVQERLAEAKEAFLADRAAHGDDRDPFAEAEEQEMLRSRDARRRHLAMAQQAASAQSAPATLGAPLVLGAPQAASTPVIIGQSLYGGFVAGSAPASAPASPFNFASSGSSLFGAAPASSLGLFGGAGAFGAAQQSPVTRKGSKSRK